MICEGLVKRDVGRIEKSGKSRSEFGRISDLGAGAVIDDEVPKELTRNILDRWRHNDFDSCLLST